MSEEDERYLLDMRQAQEADLVGQVTALVPGRDVRRGAMGKYVSVQAHRNVALVRLDQPPANAMD